MKKYDYFSSISPCFSLLLVVVSSNIKCIIKDTILNLRKIKVMQSVDKWNIVDKKRYEITHELDFLLDANY